MRAIPIKTDEELDIQREAGRLAAEVLLRVAAAVEPGITSRELDGLAAATMSLLGVRSAFLGYHGYPAQCCISVNDCVIHGIPDDRPIAVGDVVSLDVGIWHGAFIGDNALTVVVGEATPDTTRLVRHTEEALMAGIAACRPGARVGDISHAVELVAVRHGLSVVREFVGHGCGRALHEEPQIPNFGRSGRGPLLRPGMVLCIEPMLNLGTRAIHTLDDGWTVKTRDGKPAAHFEHMVAITPDGAEILTPRPWQHVRVVTGC